MKIIKKIIKISLLSLLLFFLLLLSIYIYAKCSDKLPINSANSYYLYDKDNNLYNGNNKEWIKLNKISHYLVDATLSVEDKNFYNHYGFDILRIIKAMGINITNGKTLQGASTITQQYAKNLFLNFNKTWSRKITEAFLTIKLETHYTKDEILEGYLNTINYGGVFGIENASHYYFGKSASDLTLAEASILAGIPKSPSNYSPLADEKKAKERQKLILKTMVKNKYITKKEMNDAYNTTLTYKKLDVNDNLSTLMYYEDAVFNELNNISSIPDSFIETGGLKIYTNLDMNAQIILNDKIKNNIDQDSQIEIASVLMNPTNGNILAIAGGRDYSKSEFNRVTNSKRQVGSTMKPFLYYAALENGFTSSTTFTSEKTTFAIDNNKTYSPTNYGGVYANKLISMAAAIAYSDNIYAVKTHLFLGEDVLVDMAKRLGITTKLNSIPSLALGTNEINILQMMQAYGILANEGYKIKPHFIEKVEDIDGNILYEYKNELESILNKSIVFILNNLLTNSYAKEFIDYTYPTCINIAPKMTKTYAIKTGTTNTDHLIFGYNKDAILGIWMGYDDNRDTDIKDGSIMKNIWIDVMESYLKDKENNWYDIPDNVVGVLVDPISGVVANENSTNKSKIFYYIKGTQPLFDDDLDKILPTIKENN
ncbi:MAG: PBP1A family penicillin-binding protein [Bacilli bacterium]|nr:PBP1A family penicillin-binding protein [Bacilli bacterium]